MPGKNNIFAIFTAKNIIITQVIVAILALLFIRVHPSLTYSVVGERIAETVSPYIYKEHFEQSLITKSWPAIVGYVNKHSIQPGQKFDLMLSTVEKNLIVEGRIEISRIGYFPNADREIVYQSELESVRSQPVTASSFIVGMPWKSHHIDIPTADWKSGYYAFDFVEISGQRHDDIAFVVVTNPHRKGDILVKLSTNTYQAYNKWGGGSLYSTILRGVPHADTVSFDRPTVSQFYRWEYYYVLWLEELANKLGFTVDYATNFDFYREPKIADEYKILISLGHDEYWSQEEFESHYDRIFALGKNTLFLGANSAYFRVRYGDIHGTQSWPNRGRQLICFKNSLAEESREVSRLYDPVIYADEGSSHATGLFRGQIGFPETMLMGVGFENHFPPDPSTRYTYYVKSVVPWLFEGTGLEVGDRLADVVGYQWDNISLIHNGVTVWSESESRVPFLPRENLRVLFEGKPISGSGREGLAQGVFFISEAGAKVFSAGTIRWAWGLGKLGFVETPFRRLNRNLIVEFLK